MPVGIGNSKKRKEIKLYDTFEKDWNVESIFKKKKKKRKGKKEKRKWDVPLDRERYERKETRIKIKFAPTIEIQLI